MHSLECLRGKRMARPITRSMSNDRGVRLWCFFDRSFVDLRGFCRVDGDVSAAIFMGVNHRMGIRCGMLQMLGVALGSSAGRPGDEGLESPASSV